MGINCNKERAWNKKFNLPTNAGIRPAARDHGNQFSPYLTIRGILHFFSLKFFFSNSNLKIERRTLVLRWDPLRGQWMGIFLVFSEWGVTETPLSLGGNNISCGGHEIAVKKWDVWLVVRHMYNRANLNWAMETVKGPIVFRCLLPR